MFGDTQFAQYNGMVGEVEVLFEDILEIRPHHRNASSRFQVAVDLGKESGNFFL